MTDELVNKADEVKKRFEAEGKTVSGWADERGYPRDAVYRVLNGFTPCKRGRSHDIAVALGIKANPANFANPSR